MKLRIYTTILHPIILWKRVLAPTEEGETTVKRGLSQRTEYLPRANGSQWRDKTPATSAAPKLGKGLCPEGPRADFFLSCIHVGCPQKEQARRYNTEAQPYKSGDADVGTCSQFTHLDLSSTCLRLLLKLHVPLPALVPSGVV